MSKIFRSTIFLFGMLLVGGAVRPAAGCSTPVFRYALENWQPDLYRLTVRHAGPLTPEMSAYIKQLGEYREGRAVANVYVDEKNDPAVRPGEAVQAYFPRHPAQTPPIAAVALTREAVGHILTSPVRETLAEKLLAGETAVWLFLESGNGKQDAAALKRLREALKKMKELLRLPEEYIEQFADENGNPDNPDNPGETEAPKISFSILKIKREDPKESFLVRSLLLSEPDLENLKQPMVFPVFGRGRALYALVGKGINREIIAEACAFMTGACSCQVKAMNPGVDLLLTANWDSVYNSVYYREEAPPPLATVMPVEDADGQAKSKTAAARMQTARVNDANPEKGGTTPPGGSRPRAAAAPESAPGDALSQPVKKNFPPLAWTVAGVLVLAVIGIGLATPFLLRH
jgi:hypothetical protein